MVKWLEEDETGSIGTVGKERKREREREIGCLLNIDWNVSFNKWKSGTVEKVEIRSIGTVR